MKKYDNRDKINHKERDSVNRSQTVTAQANSHRVLVTGVGGNIGQGIVKALRASRHPFRVIGIDMEPLSAGFSLVDRYEVVPRTSAPEFEAQFKEIAKWERPEAVYVCSPTELEYFSTHRERLEKECNLKIFVNPPEVCRIGSDKYETARFLKEHGFRYPLTALAEDEEEVRRLAEAKGFPLVMKPVDGFTSRHVYLVHSHEEIQAARRLVPQLVVQEHLPEDGGEYTAGTISGSDRNVRAHIVLRRDLLQGTTYRTELYRDARVEAELVRIVEALGAVGTCNVQFRLVGEEVVVFEINPRFSGTSGVRYLYGFNDPEMMYDLFCLGREIRQPVLKPAVVLRYWNEVCVPDADFRLLRNGGKPHQGFQTVIETPRSSAH